ncbi:MAG: transporter substrate-binding domain-containing protein [Bacteroidales bacterium]
MKRFNRMLSLYVVLLVLVLLTMGGIRFYHQSQLPPPPRDLTEIRKEGILRIAVDYNKSSYFVSGDTIAGLEYELCRSLEKVSNLKVEIYPEANLANSLQGLLDQRVDIVARPIPITLPYKEEFNFSLPLFTNKLVLVQRKASDNNGIEPIRNQLELARKTVYLPAASASRQRLDNLTVEIADSIYFTEESVYGEEQLIMQVARHEIDYAICSESIARGLIRDYPNLDILTAIGFNQFRGWALRKDSPVLLDSLNSWLEKEMQTPQFKNKINRYIKNY